MFKFISDNFKVPSIRLTNTLTNYLSSLMIFIGCFFSLNCVANELRLPLNNWASQRVITLAIGEDLRSEGIKVTFVPSSIKNQYGALLRGKLHFQIEEWQSSSTDLLARYLKEGKIVDMGNHSTKSREDWWYPDYVEKVCPELPNWRALNQCASLFSVDGKSGKGIYFNGPWEFNDAGLIRALDLNFTIKHLDNSHLLRDKIIKANDIKKPIMIVNWSPNWTDSRIPGKFVEFPIYHPECETNPKWGINPKLAYDCGNTKEGWIKKIAWPGLEKKLPCVFQYLKNIDLAPEMLSEAAALVDIDGFSELESANIWSKKYQSHLAKWKRKSCLSQ